MTKFRDAVEENFERLGQYVPIVARVHGEAHPEFHEVKRVFDEIDKKINADEQTKPNLDEEFVQLREITNNYTVPCDVCESYEAVYDMLKALDVAYQE